MKLVSWNVNGLRAILGKGMGDAVEALEPDVLCLQEIKARPEQVNDLWISSWPHQLWNPAEKAGYSGVLILSRVQPLSTSTGIGWPEHDREGRVCTMEFEQFYLVNCYTPNSQNELVRLPYREQWDAAFRKYVAALAETKPVVFCGDLNVAHEEIDIARPRENRFPPGSATRSAPGSRCCLRPGSRIPSAPCIRRNRAGTAGGPTAQAPAPGTSDGALTTSAFPIRWLPG